MSDGEYRFYGKTESNFFPFWRIYGNFTVEVLVPGGSSMPNMRRDVDVKITGKIQRNDKNIEVEIVKPKYAYFFEIRKFNSVSKKKVGMMDVLNYIQSGTAGSSFATAGSYFKAGILDNMQWDQFTGYGSIDPNKKFTLVMSSKNEIFPTTEENAKMHLVIEGTGESAANFAFLSTFTSGRIMTTFPQFTTLDKKILESYFEFDRVQPFNNWCYILSSSDFFLQANIQTWKKFQTLFSNLFDDRSSKLLNYEMSRGSTIRVKQDSKGGFIPCGNGQSLSMNQNNEQTYLSGHIEAFGIRWSYGSSSQSSVVFSKLLNCSHSVVPLPAWFSSITDIDVDTKLIDVYKNNENNSFNVEININSGASVQNPLPTDLVKTFAMKKIELQYEQFGKVGKYRFYIDALLNGSNNIMVAMIYVRPSWHFNIKVQSLPLKKLFDELGPVVKVLPFGWRIVKEISVESLNVLIDMGRRNLIRVTGTVTLKELPGIDVEAVYQVGNGFAVGFKCGNFNFEKVFEMIYEDVLNLDKPPKHTVPWLTSINSMIMLSGMSKKDEATFQHPDLNTFEDMRKGVAFRFEWNRPDTQSEECIKDEFCTFLSEHFTEGGSFVLTGEYQNKVFQIESDISTDITITDHLLFTGARILLKVDHSKEKTKLTFGLGAQMKYFTEGSADSLRTPLIFEGYIEISADKAFKLLFTMRGKADNPFGLPYISIADAQFGVERVTEDELKFMYIRVHIGTLALGNIKNITKQEDGEIYVPDDAISLKGTLGINPKAWYLSYFALSSPNPLTLGKLEDMFGIKVLPKGIREYGFQENLTVQYAPTKIDNLPNGESINRGFRLKSRFKMLAWSGDADINLDLTNLEFHADINMEPISWFWGAIKMFDFEGVNGPHLKMDISSTELKGNISGSVQILNITTTATRLVFNERGLLIKQATLNCFYLEIELYYGLSPVTGRFLLGFKDCSLKNLLNKLLDSAWEKLFGHAQENKKRGNELEEQNKKFLEEYQDLVKKNLIKKKIISPIPSGFMVPLATIFTKVASETVPDIAIEVEQFMKEENATMTDLLFSIGKKIKAQLKKFIQRNIEVKVNQATVQGSFDDLSTAGIRVVIDAEYKFGIYNGSYNFNKTYGEDSQKWREINVHYFEKVISDGVVSESGYKKIGDDMSQTTNDISVAENKFKQTFKELEKLPDDY